MPNNPRIIPIEKATNKPWAEWVAFMDKIDAKNLDHKTIAEKVYPELEGYIDNSGWWAQAVVIAYEQEIGRRVPGQRSDGTFAASISKSTKLEMVELIQKWADFADKDNDVLDQIEGDPRKSGSVNRHSWRVKSKDDYSIMVSSEPKKDGAASLVIQLEGFESQELSLQAKEKWASILGNFISLIT